MATQSWDESVPSDLTTWGLALGIAVFTAITSIAMIVTGILHLVAPKLLSESAQ